MENTYFEKNSSGEILYYPWSGGKSYTVSRVDRDKFWILFSINLYLLLTFIIALNVFTSLSFLVAVPLIINASVVSSLVLSFFYVKSLSHTKKSTAKTNRSIKSTVKSLLILFVVQALCTLFLLFLNPQISFLWLMGGGSLIFYPLLIGFFYYKKGFILKKHLI